MRHIVTWIGAVHTVRVAGVRAFRTCQTSLRGRRSTHPHAVLGFRAFGRSEIFPNRVSE